jgi:hypothetical protein
VATNSTRTRRPMISPFSSACTGFIVTRWEGGQPSSSNCRSRSSVLRRSYRHRTGIWSSHAVSLRPFIFVFHDQRSHMLEFRVYAFPPLEPPIMFSDMLWLMLLNPPAHSPPRFDSPNFFGCF